MTDWAPILIAALVLVVTAIVAARHGSIAILAGGASLLVALIVWVVTASWLPWLGDTFLDVYPGWRLIIGVASLFAVVAFGIARILSGWILRRLLGRDAPLHFLAEGAPAAMVSVFPGLVVVVFLFSCFRVAGTLHELNYVASISRDEITDMGGRIPPYPWTSAARNRIEDVPMVAEGLDVMDPFSERAARNAAALLILSRADATRDFAAAQEETSAILKAPEFRDLVASEEVAEALKEEARVGLVLHPRVASAARDSALSTRLERLHLRPLLERFVDSIPVSEPRETGIESTASN